MMTLVGVTTDGKSVIAGVFKEFETNGMPLCVLFEELKRRESIPCWISFHQEAEASGMRHDRILPKLEEAITDVWGAAFSTYVCKALRVLHERGQLTARTSCADPKDMQ